MQELGSALPGALWGAIALLPGAILGAAYGPITRATAGIPEEIELRRAFELAREQTDWRIGARIVRPVVDFFRRMFRSDAPPSTEATWLKVVLAVAGICFIVQQYVAHTELVVFTLLILTVVMVVASLSTFLVLAVRHVIEAGSVAGQLTGAIGMSTVAIASAVFLIEPPFQSAALIGVRDYLAASKGVLAVLFAPDLGMVLYQLTGAGITLIGLIASIGMCTAAMTAVHLARGIRGRWLWRFCFWAARPFSYPRLWWTLFGLVIAAGILTSGLGYEWVSNASDSPTPLPT